ncbi:MAG: hypothetical protein H0T62_07900 [Parachlamydiaceae bacterium]|nr:hypothetical protein [Parachlamydiaceae bacterium]
MNSLNSLFENVNYTNASIADRFQMEQEILGISNDMVFQKFIFGFFENGVTDYRIEENDPTACAQLEFCASSLSAKSFLENLTHFLETEDAKNGLTPQTYIRILAFMTSIRNGVELSQLIDLIRSLNNNTIILLKTGNIFGTVFKNNEQSSTVGDNEVERLIMLTLSKIEILKLGESASFLAGNWIHETQITVDRTESGKWEIFYCDTGSASPLQVYSLTKEEIIDSDLWKNIYSTKILDQGSPILFKEESRVTTPSVLAAEISTQKHNTCHIQSQIALLKTFIVYKSPLPYEDTILEWKHFKCLFGKYLLTQDKFENTALSEICKIGHQKHQHTFKVATYLHNSVCEGKYEEITKVYRDLFEKCKFEWEEPTLGSPLLSLLKFRKSFSEKIRYLSSFEELMNVIGTEIDPVLQNDLVLFKKHFSEKQTSWNIPPSLIIGCIKQKEFAKDDLKIGLIKTFMSKLSVEEISLLRGELSTSLPEAFVKFIPIHLNLESLQQLFIDSNRKEFLIEYLIKPFVSHLTLDYVHQFFHNTQLLPELFIDSILSTLTLEDVHRFFLEDLPRILSDDHFLQEV